METIQIQQSENRVEVHCLYNVIKLDLCFYYELCSP